MKISPDKAYDTYEQRVNGSTHHNDMLIICHCHEAEKVTHALLYMVIAPCIFFERFLFEVTGAGHAYKCFKKWCKEKGEEGVVDKQIRIELEAYFNIRHAIMHLGGQCSALDIFNRGEDNSNNLDFRNKVRAKLKEWGIEETTDLCDFSEQSQKCLENAWSGVRGFLKKLAEKDGLTRVYFRELGCA